MHAVTMTNNFDDGGTVFLFDDAFAAKKFLHCTYLQEKEAIKNEGYKDVESVIGTNGEYAAISYPCESLAGDRAEIIWELRLCRNVINMVNKTSRLIQ